VPLSLVASLLLVAAVFLVFGWGSSVETYAAQLAADHLKCFQFPPDPTSAVDVTMVAKTWQKTAGWPLKADTYGGSFLYHMAGNLVAVGFVVGLLCLTSSAFAQAKDTDVITSTRSSAGSCGGSRCFYVAVCVNNGNGASLSCAASPGGVGAFNTVQAGLNAATTAGDWVLIGDGTYDCTSDGSGDADVSNVASLRFTSGSGDLKAHHVVGDVVVKVGSGDAIIDDIGSLNVERVGSGDIRASNARGDVKVGHVGSGDVNFADVRGGVHIESVGSGDVGVRRAGGDVEIGSIGSGDVTVDGVGGNFIVHSAGSGDLHHHQVTGKVEVPKRHQDD